MNYFDSASTRIIDRFARRLMSDAGDAAPGAGAAPAAPAPSPAAGGDAAPPADGAPPAAAAAPDAPAAKSLLTDAKAEGGDEPPPAETDDQKAAREAKEAEDKAAAKTAALAALDVLKLPEGMPTDQPAFVDFKNAAVDLEIPPEKAQALLDTVAPKLKEALEAPYNAWADLQEKWATEAKGDKEYGGADFERNLGVAARALDTYGTPELRVALAETGFGNHPEAIRWMYRVGKTLAEGKPVVGIPKAGEPVSTARKLYPNMNPTS